MSLRSLTLALLLFLSFPEGSFAQSTDAFGQNNYFGGQMPNQAPSTQNTLQNDAINEAARLERERLIAAANYNMAVAMLLFMECQKQKKNELCMLGMLAMQQAQSMMAEANQARATAQASEVKTGTIPVDPGSGGNFVNPKDPRVLAAKETLDKAGISVREDGTVKMPDGSELPPATFKSADAMSAAGLDPQALDVAAKIAEEEAEKSPVSKGLADAPTGGASFPAAELPPESSGRARGPASTQPRKLSGKTVLLGGEPIGVRGDDIFSMIQACYQKKIDGNQFILSEKP